MLNDLSEKYENEYFFNIYSFPFQTGLMSLDSSKNKKIKQIKKLKAKIK